MDRRAFIGTMAGGLLAAPFAAGAQPAGKVYRIGFLAFSPPDPSLDGAFRRGLRDHGYIEGRNVVIEYRSADGQLNRLPDRAADPSVWPGPFCHPRPSKGVLESEVGGKVTILGDLFTGGWLTYFWSTAAGQFDAVLTSD